MANRATRYSGSLRIVVELQADYSYNATLYGTRMLCALQGLNLSPYKRARIAADSSEAFSLIAGSSVSFAMNDNPEISDEIFSLANFNDRGEVIISTKRK